MGDPFKPRYVRPTIIVLDSENRILLVRYCEDNSWGIPGGMMEIGESVDESARRELLEETGLTAKNMTLKAAIVYKEILNIVFVANEYTGELRSDGVETNEAHFFSLANLPENLNPFIRQSLMQLANGL